ncbi:hypothetical protein BpHYR1_047018 [Brachionus plicatilis]|uniref:Uncharacterized protein n=1 Tax=Brachionus plicatilis TaxID=10195 RepID=A0A3M7RR70_BRAPC|nr:hypothetical protein BpHYR1_047018 [Brachionus plicatilis]
MNSHIKSMNMYKCRAVDTKCKTFLILSSLNVLVFFSIIDIDIIFVFFLSDPMINENGVISRGKLESFKIFIRSQVSSQVQVRTFFQSIYGILFYGKSIGLENPRIAIRIKLNKYLLFNIILRNLKSLIFHYFWIDWELLKIHGNNPKLLYDYINEQKNANTQFDH